MNEDRITFDKIEKRKMIRNIGIFVILILVAILIVIFPEFKREDISTVEFSAVDKICELSTLRCYYHDVAEYEKQPDGLFQYGLFKYGYKKFWIEYDGIVELGIDVDKVQVNQPDENNIVYVYVPDARIIVYYWGGSCSGRIKKFNIDNLLKPLCLLKTNGYRGLCFGNF